MSEVLSDSPGLVTKPTQYFYATSKKNYTKNSDQNIYHDSSIANEINICTGIKMANSELV